MPRDSESKAIYISKGVVTIKSAIEIMVGFLIGYAIMFGITALIVKGICWAFDFAFTWKLAVGVWLILILLRTFIVPSKK